MLRLVVCVVHAAAVMLLCCVVKGEGTKGGWKVVGYPAAQPADEHNCIALYNTSLARIQRANIEPHHDRGIGALIIIVLRPRVYPGGRHCFVGAQFDI